MKYSEQWPQNTIERHIPSLRDRASLLSTVIHARDYLLSQANGDQTLGNAAEILMDGIQNVLDSSATGLEWWTIRHRLSDQEIQSGKWLDDIKTTWITAREAEQKRDGKQR